MPLYFQVQFLKLECTDNAKSTIKNALKSERKKKVSSLKHHQGPGKKCKELKRHYRDPQSRRQYQKRKYQENPEYSYSGNP